MALIIPTFKQGNKTTTNAYAKVVRVQVDNNTKKASFNTLIYKSNEDRTLLASIPQQVINFTDGVDILQQCYNSIPTKISELENQIDALQVEVDADNTLRRKVFQIATLKASVILVLKNAIDDI